MNGTSSSQRPSIEIIVNTDGTTSVQTHGFRGASCRDASAFLKRALGRVTSDCATAEMHQQVHTQQREHEAS